MKAVSIVSLSLFALLAVCSALPDYCSKDLCTVSSHIGCGNNGTLGPNCPVGTTKMVQIGDALIAKILDRHNSKRNTLASGKLAGFRPAERMPTMQWDKELAYLAALNVRTCVFAHDTCHNTNAFKYSGQNLGKKWWFGSTQTDEAIILDHIDGWWNENKDARQSDLDKYPIFTSAQIGHFTVMAADKNIAVGCAAIKFPENSMSTLTLACNYATTNVLGLPIYKSGNTASKCLSGTNSNYSGLCSPLEKIDPNALFV